MQLNISNIDTISFIQAKCKISIEFKTMLHSDTVYINILKYIPEQYTITNRISIFVNFMQKVQKPTIKCKKIYQDFFVKDIKTINFL